MPILTSTNLKREIVLILKKQGYLIKPNGLFVLRNNDKETKRKAHDLAKAERIANQENFILEKSALAKLFLVDGKNLEDEKIFDSLVTLGAFKIRKSIDNGEPIESVGYNIRVDNCRE